MSEKNEEKVEEEKEKEKPENPEKPVTGMGPPVYFGFLLVGLQSAAAYIGGMTIQWYIATILFGIIGWFSGLIAWMAYTKHIHSLKPTPTSPTVTENDVVRITNTIIENRKKPINRCPQCRHIVMEDDAYCKSCGYNLKNGERTVTHYPKTA